MTITVCLDISNILFKQLMQLYIFYDIDNFHGTIATYWYSYYTTLASLTPTNKELRS